MTFSYKIRTVILNNKYVWKLNNKYINNFVYLQKSCVFVGGIINHTISAT